MKRAIIVLALLCCIVLIFAIIGPSTTGTLQRLGELTEGARLELLHLLR